MYSPLFYERTIAYSDWVWDDFQFLHTENEDNFEYRHSDYHSEILNGNGVIKFNSRWVFDKLNYCSDGEGIFN